MGAWGGALSSLAPDRIAPTVSWRYHAKYRIYGYAVSIYLGRSITEAIKPAITEKEITEIEELAVAGIVI